MGEIFYLPIMALKKPELPQKQESKKGEVPRTDINQRNQEESRGRGLGARVFKYA